MEDRRFDQLTRSIAKATNRRDFMRRLLGIAGIAGGAFVLHTGEADAARRGFAGPCIPAAGRCVANAQCCTNFCDYVGPAGVCAICDATICGDFVCTDLEWDPRNCGSCGHVCGSGSICNSGKCNTGA